MFMRKHLHLVFLLALLCVKGWSTESVNARPVMVALKERVGIPHLHLMVGHRCSRECRQWQVGTVAGVQGVTSSLCGKYNPI